MIHFARKSPIQTILANFKKTHPFILKLCPSVIQVSVQLYQKILCHVWPVIYVHFYIPVCKQSIYNENFAVLSSSYASFFSLLFLVTSFGISHDCLKQCLCIPPVIGLPASHRRSRRMVVTIFWPIGLSTIILFIRPNRHVVVNI